MSMTDLNTTETAKKLSAPPDLDKLSEQARQATLTLIAVNGTLHAEIERLRGEVAKAKTLGAAEELERLRKQDCKIGWVGDMPHITYDQLKARAAKLRKDLA